MKKERRIVVGSKGQPQAWITLQKNRLKKEREAKSQESDIVYLEDDQEFEIELYNPKKFPTLVKIKLNGNYISERGLILEPGQRWFLDRYIDNNKKFKFSTYNIENSEESKEAISYNGLVEIEFYEEVKPISGIYNGINWGRPYWTTDWSQPGIFYTGDNIPTGHKSTSNISNYSSDISNDSGILNKKITYSKAIDISETRAKATMDSLNFVENSIETGRVNEGSKSEQNFERGSGTFNSFVSNVCRYRILPISLRPIKKGELRKYCTNCSIRIRKTSWKFCPSCGESID